MSSNECSDRGGSSTNSPASSSETLGGGSQDVGQGSGGDTVDGEEQEESSSSSHTEDRRVEDALTTFREQWQQELKVSPCHELKSTVHCPNRREDVEAEAIENKAKSLFIKGVENEQNRKFYEAIQFYRRAIQLVPDIEFRLHEASKLKPRERQETGSSDDGFETEGNKEEDSESDEELDKDFLSRMQRMFSRSHCICVPRQEQKVTHMSILPMEIMLYILRWVVSSELDLRSLEMCSRVCRGFYLCSRDPEIWRLACIRVWDVNCGKLAEYDTWRQMFIERPRLHFNGCYISKTTYFRHGENSFQDQFYRPWHLVEYYRYLRFFPEGLVLMLTTPDDPMSSLSQLRHRLPRNPAVMTGHYILHDDRVILVLKRQESHVKMTSNNRYRGRRRDNAQDMGTQTFHLELQILNYRDRTHAQLIWQCYSVYTMYRSGQDNTTTFDLLANRYPPFWFSRVKSYTAESENPL